MSEPKDNFKSWQTGDQSVSVVIPTYKHASTVVQTLESVFAQTLQPKEIIVINDGSPDNTEEVLRPYIESGRIRYFSQPNAGQGAARNRGIALASGDFIALLDDDDYWPPDKLQWQVEVLANTPKAVIVYGNYTPFGTTTGRQVPGTRGPSGSVFRRLLWENFICSPGQTLIRREALQHVGFFDESVWGADDWEVMLRLAKIGEFAFENRNALFYRFHIANASKNMLKMVENVRKVMDKHLVYRPGLLGLYDRYYYSRTFARMRAIHILAHAHQGVLPNRFFKLAKATFYCPNMIRLPIFRERIKAAWTGAPQPA